MRKKPLELCLYAAGAAAFGVFVRWLQLQIAFNEQDLPDKSFFNIAVPVLIGVIVIMFVRFVDAYRNGHCVLPEDVCGAFANPGMLHKLVRIAAGAVMSVGGIVLLLQCETDRSAAFLCVLAAVGIVTGVSHPLLLSAANKGEPLNRRRVCFYSAMPILLFSVWLVTCYKIHSIDPVRWSYAIEIIACCVSIISFFRLAGFAFDQPSPWRSLFFTMLGAVMCAMCLADERYLGQQLMLVGAMLMQLQYAWIICANLRREDGKPLNSEDVPNDGFERLR